MRSMGLIENWLKSWTFYAKFGEAKEREGRKEGDLGIISSCIPSYYIYRENYFP